MVINKYSVNKKLWVDHMYHLSLLAYRLSELPADLVEGAQRTHPLRGLLSVAWSALSQSFGGMFLRLLLGSKQLPPAWYAPQNQILFLSNVFSDIF